MVVKGVNCFKITKII